MAIVDPQPKRNGVGEVVLAVGTSRRVVFQGGPQPWVGKPSAHYTIGKYKLSSFILELDSIFLRC